MHVICILFYLFTWSFFFSCTRAFFSHTLVDHKSKDDGDVSGFTLQSSFSTPSCSYIIQLRLPVISLHVLRWDETYSAFQVEDRNQALTMCCIMKSLLRRWVGRDGRKLRTCLLYVSYRLLTIKHNPPGELSQVKWYFNGPKPGRTLMAMQRRVGELVFSTSTRRCARLRRGRDTTILRCGTARAANDAPKDAASLARPAR